MKKNELKVGEEYAAFRQAEHRSQRSYSFDKPMRVKLIELGGELSDTFVARSTVYKDGAAAGTKDNEQTVKVNGIIAEIIGDPIVATVPDVTRSTHGRTKALIPAYAVEKLYRSYGSDEPEIGSHERSYQRVALENAGCFLMTWAQWEAKQVAEKKREEKSKREHEEQVAREAANDPAMRAKLQAMVDALVERGLEVDARHGLPPGRPDPWYDAATRRATHVGAARPDLQLRRQAHAHPGQEDVDGLLAELLGVEA